MKCNFLYQWIKRLYFIYAKLKQEELCMRVTIGKDSRFYPSAVVENMQDVTKIKIGENVHIRGKLLVYPYGEGISIGNNSYIGENTVIRAAEKIVIGNSVLIAHNVNIIDTDSHEMNYIERDVSFKLMVKVGHPRYKGNVETTPIIIEDNVWISYNVCILKGVTIGKGAIIGCGSVVTHDIPAFCVAAGNPAKIIRKLL